MSYSYETQKKELFTESGVELLIKARDRVKTLLAFSGAFTAGKMMDGIDGDLWTMLAALDLRGFRINGNPVWSYGPTRTKTFKHHHSSKYHRVQVRRK